MSPEAFSELQQLNSIMQQLSQNQGQQKDEWSYIWNSNTYYTTKFYMIPFLSIRPPQPFQWIWKSKCSKKIKIFTWLLFLDRLNTRNILRRKRMPVQGNNYNCQTCAPSTEETTFHLFFQCPFAVRCWRHIGVQWNTSMDFFEMIQQARKEATMPNFMEIFTIAAWNIWKQRNRLIFDNIVPTLHTWWEAFREEVQLQVHRTKPATRDNILTWLNQIIDPVIMIT